MKTIKKSVYFMLMTMVVFSCQSNKQEIIAKKDFSFITDSLRINYQLKKHNLAGFSLVVFENYEVVYTNQFGVKSSTSNEKLDQNTAFSTASMAKPIVAILCHILEEKGLINLDDPIDNYLKRWHLPKSKFTENNNPTWKELLNHTAGVNQNNGFADFYEGDTIPTIKESLMGQKLPRKSNTPIDFLFTPGTSWGYSGGGYVIVQMALEDTLNTSLAELADTYVFTPMGLKNTTMIQPNESGFLTNVALVHDQNNKVIKTGLPITPQVGPSGLWSSPTDLAKITIEIQNALRNKNNNVISNSIAKKVMKVTALKDAVGGWSYGGQRSFGFNNYDWVRIGGSNTGVGGDVYATMTDGNGFAFLANGEKPNRSPVIGNTTVKLLKIMDWNKKLDEEIVEIPANIKEKLIGTYNDFLHRPFSVEILEKDNKLYASTPFFEFFGGKKKNEMMYLKNGLFRIKNYPNLLKFNMINGNPNSVTLIRDNITAEVKLIKK
jgi:CubicO group peptidase (beta-lactamase class C family)